MSERLARTVGLLLLLVAWSAAVSGDGSAGQAGRLVEFELADQFDRVHRSAEYRDRYLVLIASDRGGSRFNPQWGRAIQSALEGRSHAERVAIVYLAHFKGVPRLLKGFIKRRFPDDERIWVLMDWEGLFKATYGFERKRSNMLVFAPTGDLLFRASGRKPDASVVERLVDMVAPRADG